jgi:hypothetical protein
MSRSIWQYLREQPIHHGRFESTYNSAAEYLPQNRHQLTTLLRTFDPKERGSQMQFGSIPGLGAFNNPMVGQANAGPQQTSPLGRLGSLIAPNTSNALGKGGIR